MAAFKKVIPLLCAAIVLIGVQLGVTAAEKEFFLTQLTMALYYAIVVMGLCLLMGRAGQVSLGQGAFFAIGGYTSAILTTADFSRFKSALWAGWLQKAHVFIPREDLYGGQILTVSPWGGFFGAMALTFVVACLIGYPALRLKGHYLAMATLGFGLIVNKFVLGTAFTGAADGINGVPEWNLVGSLTISGKSSARVSNYYIACGLVLLVLALLRNVFRSKTGRALLAIHDRETAANAMGINTANYKLQAFVISAMLAATAGVFFTHYTAGIGPSEASAFKSVRYVALAAVSGMASLWGVTVISTLINFFSLRGCFGSYDLAVFGFMLIAIMSLTPEGPLKPLQSCLSKLWTKPRGQRCPAPRGKSEPALHALSPSADQLNSKT